MSEPLGPLLFDDIATRTKRVHAVLPNLGLHTNGEAVAAAHPRAIQYLEAAPVLAVALPQASWKRQRAVNEFVRLTLEPLCERGATLKEIMRAFKLAPPLRRLSGYGLAPGYTDLVLALSRLDPAVLGRIIPQKPGAQKRWLSACEGWRDHMMRKLRWSSKGLPDGLDTRFAWAAEAMALTGVRRRDVGHVADFAVWNTWRPEEAPFNEAWGWPRAAEEAHRWHARLTVERALIGTPFKPDTRIDLGDHPEATDDDEGFEFLALRTPVALADEGGAMRHCVATYLNSVANGVSHIVSIRRGGTRVATLELDRAWSVVQCKGKANAEPAPEVIAAARAYAASVRVASKLARCR